MLEQRFANERVRRIGLAILLVMLMSAIIHMVILAVRAVIEDNAHLLSLVTIFDLDIIFGVELNDASLWVSNVVMVAWIGLMYWLIGRYWFNKKS